MKRMSTRVAATAFAVPFVAAAAAAIWIGNGPLHRSATTARRLSSGERARLANLAMPFIENNGQSDGRVAFYAPTFAGTAFVNRKGALVLSLPGRPGNGKAGGWTLVEDPRGGSIRSVRGVQPTATRVSIFQGARSHWRSNLETYAAVSLGAVWPGVDYSLRAHGDNVERLFTVQPGAAVSAIRMRVKGVRGLRVHQGRLVAETGRGPVTLSRPRAWQRIDGRRLPVRVSYTVSAQEYGFRLGDYDHGRPVVIDPVIRTTYLGGSNGASSASAMQELSSNGNIYLAGVTSSPSFPGISGGAQTALAGSKDAFVAELNPDLSQIIQATYLGGSADDSAAALAIAPAGTPMAGDVYVAGTTQSSNFPGTTGGAQPSCAGGASGCQSTGDAFVAVLSSDLKTLIQASYLGGTSFDNGEALAIAPSSASTSGDVYLAGRTLSTDFPFVSGGAQPAPAATANYQGFVARFNPGLTSVSQASYLGGSGVNEAYAITVAPSPATSGLVYVAGDTSSTDFPCTNAGGPAPSGGACASSATSGAQAALGGGFDAFAAELNPGLTQLLQASYLGGTDLDSADVIRVAPSGTGQAGQVFIGGLTYSTDFPGVAGNAQPALAGTGDADGFVARLSPALTTLGGATYLGGTKADVVQALAFTGNNLYVAGTTSSDDFPCTAPAGPNPAGGACVQQHAGALYRYGGGASDGFVALLDAGLSSVTQATYMGGAGTDSITDVSLAPAASTYSGVVIVGGGTTSAKRPATSGSARPAVAGSGSAFAAAISPDLQSPEVTLNVSASGPATVNKGQNFTMTVTVTNTSTSNGAADAHILETLNSATSSGQLSYVGVSVSQGTCTEQNQFVDCSLGTLAANGGSATMTLKVNAAKDGKVDSLITATSTDALSPSSNYNITHSMTIQSSSSSGGGAFEWPGLLLLGLTGLLAVRRKRLAASCG